MSFLIQFFYRRHRYGGRRVFKQIEILIFIRRYYIVADHDVTEYSLAAEKYERRRFQSRSKKTEYSVPSAQ